MLKVRCKCCNREIVSSTKIQSCGCPNMLTVREENITAVDLNKVIMLNSNKETKTKGVLTSQDLAYQEERRHRKVRKLNFDIRQMPHRMPKIKPEHLLTKKECEKMIEKAIDRHNKTATIISACLGSVLLFFYADGLLRVVGYW